MPQIDKVTFLSCVYWIFVIYVFVYLDGQVSNFFKFFNAMKFKGLRFIKGYWTSRQNYLYTRILLEGSWVALETEIKD